MRGDDLLLAAIADDEYRQVGGYVFDPSTIAWGNAVVANSGTVSAPHIVAVDAYIKSLKADGLWAKLDRLWLWASFNDGTANALVDLVGGNIATLVGPPPYGLGGFSGDDAVVPTHFIDTGYNPVTSSVNYLQNSAAMSIWCVTDPPQVNGSCDVSNDLTFNTLDIRDHDPTQTFFSINDSFSGFVTPGPPVDARGHWVLTRTGPLQTDVYQNGVRFGSNNFDVSILGLNRNFFALCGRLFGSGAAQFGTSRQQGMLAFSGGMTQTDAIHFANRTRTYMVAAGVA